MSHELVFSLLGLPGTLNNDFKKSVNSLFSFVPMLQIGKSLGTYAPDWEEPGNEANSWSCLKMDGVWVLYKGCGLRGVV